MSSRASLRLNSVPRVWEGEAPAEPRSRVQTYRSCPARQEPRPPGIAHARLGAVLAGLSLLLAACPGEASAAPIRKGDLVVTSSDDTKVQSEYNVLATLPADTALLVEDVQNDWVLVRTRKGGKELRGFIHVENLRRPAMLAHANPRGFTLKYPAGWKVASADERSDVARDVKRYFEKMGDLDPSKLPVMVFNPVEDDFIENINCAVGSGSVPQVDEDGAKRFVKGVSDAFDKLGTPLAGARAEMIQIGSKKAISAHWDLTVKDVKGPIHQWQVVIPGKSQVYVFTCSALASQFERYEPLFSVVIQSIEVDAGGTKP